MTGPVPGRALLRRTPLLPDESLPSFLARLTRLNHYASPTLLARICQERQTAALDEDDLTCPRRMDTLVQLAQLTRIPAGELLAASRHRFAPALRLSHLAAAKPEEEGILFPVEFRRHLRPDAAAQYCPECLQDSAYHRLQWIPKAAAICLEHGCWLVAGCPQCQRPLSIRELVSRRCPACWADLCAAPRIRVGEDEAGIRSQGWIQGWLCGTLLPEGFEEDGLPAEHPAILYELVECAAGWLRSCRAEGRSALSQLSPRQCYALYRAAFGVLRDWPQGLFAILDGICGQDPHPSQRLNQLQQRWFQPNREGSEYQFLKQVFVTYRLSRGLPVPLAFAHRWKRADWFVECSGICLHCAAHSAAHVECRADRHGAGLAGWGAGPLLPEWVTAGLPLVGQPEPGLPVLAGAGAGGAAVLANGLVVGRYGQLVGN